MLLCYTVRLFLKKMDLSLVIHRRVVFLRIRPKFLDPRIQACRGCPQSAGASVAADRGLD